MPNIGGWFLDDAGMVHVTLNPVGGGSVWNGGYCFDSAGRLHVTTTQTAGDFYAGGSRFAPSGALVVGDSAAEQLPFFVNGGIPYRKLDGAMARQMNQVPAPNDPYVHGIRVGTTGGVYMIDT